jgi:hypothetical protein
LGYLFSISVLISNYNFKLNKQTTMKKLLAIAIIAISFTACNDSAKKTEETKSSDTTTVVTPAMSTPDTAMVKKDTTIKMTTTVDTLKKK